jgi:hypothetical protein
MDENRDFPTTTVESLPCKTSTISVKPFMGDTENFVSGLL